MNRSRLLFAGVLAVTFGLPPAALAQSETPQGWTPELLADGQPNITGMWNNSRAMFTPLELPNALGGARQEEAGR